MEKNLQKVWGVGEGKGGRRAGGGGRERESEESYDSADVGL